MSYITSSLSPYRGDTGKEVSEILSEDYQWICSSLKSRGFIFFIAVITLMGLSVLKAITHIFTQAQKPKMTYSHLALARNMESENITTLLTHREAIEEIQNHDNLCPQDSIKTTRANTLNTLRNYLYQHDLTLHADTIKHINHRISEEELSEMYRLGKITKPLSTTHITFGEDLNNLLKEVLGNTIDLRVNKLTQETYIKVCNDDFLPIQQKLEDIYNERIKLQFD